MSLGKWFRDYVYIPLGGNRVSRGRYYLNLLLVWGLTGLWHGGAWNFVVWGLYFAFLLIIEKTWLLESLQKSRIWRHAYVIFAVVIGFVIFDAANLADAFDTLKNMFGLGNTMLVSSEAVYYLKSYAVLYLTAIIGATPLVKNVAVKWKAANYLEPIVLWILFLGATAFLVDGSYNPFLYFRF